MCRHLAYVGNPVALGTLLTDPEHSLARQAQAARHQASGTENPHGYGVGWWDPTGTLQRYRTATSIWEDPSLPALARDECSGAVLAAVRLASPGLPVEASGNAPFTDGTWLFSLNGSVDGWHDGVGDDLRALVSPNRVAAIEGVTDSAVCFALALDRLGAGAPPDAALRGVVHDVSARTTGRLNFLLTDGRTIAATTWGNSLFTRVDERAAVVASEPLDDDPAWAQVPDRMLVTVAAATVTTAPIASDELREH